MDRVGLEALKIVKGDLLDDIGEPIEQLPGDSFALLEGLDAGLLDGLGEGSDALFDAGLEFGFLAPVAEGGNSYMESPGNGGFGRFTFGEEFGGLFSGGGPFPWAGSCFCRHASTIISGKFRLQVNSGFKNCCEIKEISYGRDIGSEL